MSAPGSSPQNFNATETSSDSVSLTWDPPEAEQQNGVITGYVINVTVAMTEETFQLISSGNRLTVTVESLMPFTTYNFVIAAQTSAGIGPFSITISAQTDEAGMMKNTCNNISF